MSSNLQLPAREVCLFLVKLSAAVVFLVSPLNSSRLTSEGAWRQDGPTSVTYGDIFKRGELKIESYDLSSMPPLPAGYEALNNKAYLLTTSGSVSGPHVVHFSAASIRDEETFRKIRIFHAEPDTFDPENPVWVDRTLLGKGEDSPNFNSRTIRAGSDNLGVFVIGRQVR